MTGAPKQASGTMINILIRRNENVKIEISIDKYSTVLSLKENLFNQTGYSASEIQLVYKGKILKDELSLSYYSISDNSQIYFVPLKNSSKQKDTHRKPTQMLNRLIRLIDELPNVPYEDYFTTIDEMNELINHPILQAFARINPEVQQIFADARDIMRNTEKPISKKEAYAAAFAKDQFFCQFDQSPDGLRILQSFYEESEEENSEILSEEMRNQQIQQYQQQIRNQGNNKRSVIFNFTLDPQRPTPLMTNLNYNQTLSRKPLPNPWSSSKHSKNRSIFQNTALRISVPSPAILFQDEMTPRIKKQNSNMPTFDSSPGQIGKPKEQFATEVAVLKKKGFKDEKTIMQALYETNGNVQLAEQLLKDGHF